LVKTSWFTGAKGTTGSHTGGGAGELKKDRPHAAYHALPKKSSAVPPARKRIERAEGRACASPPHQRDSQMGKSTDRNLTSSSGPKEEEVEFQSNDMYRDKNSRKTDGESRCWQEHNALPILFRAGVLRSALARLKWPMRLIQKGAEKERFQFKVTWNGPHEKFMRRKLLPAIDDRGRGKKKRIKRFCLRSNRRGTD